MPKPRSASTKPVSTPRLPRFAVVRTVTNNTTKKQYGRSAEIELPATDATDAKSRAAALFSHETEALATYSVKAVRASNHP